MTLTKITSIESCIGYTFIELLVALAVSSIVIAGSYAGYGLLGRQHQLLNIQTSVDRNLLRVVDLIQSDIRMSGYIDVNNTFAGKQDPVIKISGTKDDLQVFYDNSDNKRILVHYYLSSYSSSVTGLTRNRLMRELRECNKQSNYCNTNTNISDLISQGPILDWVDIFVVDGGNDLIKDGQFCCNSSLNSYYGATITLKVSSPEKIEGTSIKSSKQIIFYTRSMNATHL